MIINKLRIFLLCELWAWVKVPSIANGTVISVPAPLTSRMLTEHGMREGLFPTMERNALAKQVVSLVILATLVLLVFPNSVEAATKTWDGGGIDNNWLTPANWSGDTVPVTGDDVVFDGTSIKNATVDAGFTAQPASLSMNAGYTGTTTLANDLTITGNFRLAQGNFNASSYNVTLGGNLDVSGSLTRTINLGSGTWTIFGSRFDTTGNNITITASTGLLDFISTTTINTGIGNLTILFKDINLAYPGETITLEDTSARMDVSANGQIRLKGGTINGTGTNPVIVSNQSSTADIIFDAPTTINSPVAIGYHITTNTAPMNVSGNNFNNAAAVEFLNCGGVNATIQLTGDLTAASAEIRLNPKTAYSASPNMIVDFNDKNVTAKSIYFSYSNGTTLKMGTGTIDLSGNLEVVSVGSYTLDLESAAVYIGGNWTAKNGTGVITVVPDTSTVTFDGSSAQSITTAGQSFYNLNISNIVDTVSLADAAALLTGGTLTIDPNATLDLNGNNLTVPTTLTNNGTLQLEGGETVSTPTNNSGSLVKYDGTSGPYTLKNWTYDSLQLSSSPATTYNMPATLTLNGNLTINANNTLDVTAGNFNLNVGGNWTNSGIFTAGNSTITFDGSSAQSITSGGSPFNAITITNSSVGGVTFADAFATTNFTATTANTQLTFNANSTYAISGALDLNGQAAGTEIKLRSSTSGTRWTFDVGVSNPQTVGYVDVQDSNASGSDITVNNSINRGNNDDSEPSPHWVFGNITRYWVGSAGGDWDNNNNWSTTSGGPGGADYPEAGDTAIFDGGGTNDLILDADVSVAIIDIQSGYIGKIDANEYDITTTSTLDITDGELELDTGSVLTVAGALTIDGGTLDGLNGTIDANNSVTISSGTLTAPSGNFNIAGDFTYSGGTFTANSGTVTLDGGNQNITGSTTFYNLTKSVTSAATLTFDNAATQTITNALTLNGISGQLLSLSSDAGGQQWKIDPQETRNISYVDVQDSNNINTTWILAVNSVSSGNNTGWYFRNHIGDVDNDGTDEVAMDADGNSANGYEVYSDPDCPTPGPGKICSSALLSTDGDRDNKIDHFIDTSGDANPERWWDPDEDIIQDIELIDVNRDGSDDWVYDSDNNETFDFAYNQSGSKFIDPFGIVFDSATNNEIAGAVVTIYRSATGIPAVPGIDLASGDVNPVITGSSGTYGFNAVAGDYYITVTADGYSYPFEPATKTFDVGRTICVDNAAIGYPSAACQGQYGSRGEVFTVVPVLTMDHPMDPNTQLLKLTKKANKTEASIGDIVTYTITIESKTTADITNVYITDKIPPGFKYISDRVILDNQKIDNPQGQRPITFNIGTIKAGQKRTLKYQLIIGSGVTFSKYENSAWARYSDGTRISNVATEEVKIIPDPLFDLGTVIGKVFWDRNENGVQDSSDTYSMQHPTSDNSESGIPDVQIVTEEGIIITTDKDGKYHLAGITPGRHILRIDERTLPEETYLTTDKAVIIDITPGILTKVNFGVKTSALRPHSSDNKQKTPDTAKPILNKKQEPSYHEHQTLEKTPHNKQQILKTSNIRITEDRGIAPDTGTLKTSFNTKESYVVQAGAFKNPDNSDRIAKRLKMYYPDTYITVEDGLNKIRISGINTKQQGRELMKEIGEKFKIKPFLFKAYNVNISKGNQNEADKAETTAHNIQPLTSNNDQQTEHTESGSSSTSDNRLFDELIFVGLADLKAGHTDISGNIEPVENEDKFKNGFWIEGKLAYYLRGKIKGKYLITSSLNTDREKKETFRNLDPDKYYPVYGDASTVNYEATDTQGMLYLAVEWDKSKAMWGNYHTNITDTELAQFNRTLYGGKLHYETVSTSQAGKPLRKLLIFYSQAKQKAAHNEFLGTGGSLYYLKHRPVVEGSEKAAVEIRDKNTGLVIAKVEQTEGDDYEIDYTNGRIMFYEPVSQIAKSNSIISTSILDGNPLYVVVDYEYEVNDLTYDETSYGGRVEQSLKSIISKSQIPNSKFLRDIRLGGTYIEDTIDTSKYELKGIDLTTYIGEHTRITGEYAWSKEQGIDGFISTDGGLSFSTVENYSPTESTQGKALSIKAETYLFDRLNIKAYHKRVDRGFSSTSTLSEQGKQITGGGAALEITPETHLKLSYDTQKLLDGGNTLTALQTGAQRTDTTTARLTHDMDKLKLTGEYRHIDVKEKSAIYESETNDQGDTAAIRADYEINKGLNFFLEQQATLSGKDNDQTTAGVSAKLFGWLNIKASETIGTKGNATSISTTAKVDNKTEIYNTYSTNSSYIDGRKTSIVTGGRKKLTDKMDITTETRQSSSRTEDSRTNIFGLSGKINDRWGMTGSFEKGTVQSVSGSISKRYAGSVGVSYIEKDRIKTSIKIEIRTDEGNEDKQHYLSYNAVQWKANKDTILFGKINLSESRNITMDTTEAQYKELVIGSAYRPVNFDRINLLAKYSYLEDKSAPGQSDMSDIEEQRAHILAGEAIYDLTKKWQLVEKIAFKHGEEKVTGFDFTKSQTWLWINRLNYNLYRKWQVGAEYRMLRQRQAKDIKKGALVEVARYMGKNIQIGMGYNFTDFNDDLTYLDYTAYGPFIRLSTKLTD